MKGIRYSAEFKAEAVKQITDKGYSAIDVAKRLGISDKSLSRWKLEAQKLKVAPCPDNLAHLKLENARLNKALKRAEEERDILKRPPHTLQNSPSKV